MRISHQHLLGSTAAALCLAAAAPAAAQSADAPAPDAQVEAPAPTTREPVRLEAMGGKAKGIIRPFKQYAKGDGDLKEVGGTMVRATAGRIRAFEDKAGASAGRIRAFAGEVSAFAGRIRAFSTDWSTNFSYNNNFWGPNYSELGSVSASAGRIRAFDGSLEAAAGRIRAFSDDMRAVDGSLLSFTADRADFTGISQEISSMATMAEAYWGDAIEAEGKTFKTGFLDPVLGRWGIRLGDPQSLAGLNEVDLELFLLDWRDNLMVYSGVNPIDHWMSAVNWSPRITQNMTSGADNPVKVGLIDFSVGGDQRGSVALKGGGTIETGGHGTAVASLLNGAHDGKGVMGFAPRSKLYTYNPFDSTYTADWSDITDGVLSLAGQGTSVINLSLGVPNYALHADWRTVLGNGEVRSKLQKTVFVVAAGNEGVTQTENVNMKDALDSAFIVVGSVDPNGNISGFSNRPGDTCLLEDRDCKSRVRWTKGAPGSEKSDYLKESGLLMNRFITAPGEFMLVDDGQGGVTRVSGTSFATPLVSGTVALIGDRWPWLMDKPRDVAHIILASARDAGEQGTDGTYGRGILDVEAALSPLDWNKVTFKQSLNGGGLKDTTFSALKATSSTTRLSWEANKAYFYVFENTTESHRDFYVPMSSKLVGQTVGTNRDQMNWYLQSRFQTALSQPASTDGRRIAGGPAYAFGAARFSTPAPGFGDLVASVTLSPREWRPGLRQGDAPFDTGMAFATPDGRVAMRFGSGAGGAEVDGRQGFGLQSDYDVLQGGANPYLGLASGAGYVATDVRLSDRLTVSAGMSGQTARRDLDRLSFEERMALGGLQPYQATASLLTARYRAAGWLTATASYTMLDEGAGLLGVQSLDDSDLRHGSVTDAATVGADLTPGHGLAVSMSATLGRTREGDLSRQNMGVGRGGLVSSAFQVAVSKIGVLDGRDRARVTFAQPLHVESGRLAVNQVQVVDRRTGEIGTAVDTFAFDGGPRRFVAEAMYGRQVLDGQAELSLFGRANLNGEAARQSALTLGGSFRLGF